MQHLDLALCNSYAMLGLLRRYFRRVECPSICSTVSQLIHFSLKFIAMKERGRCCNLFLVVTDQSLRFIQLQILKDFFVPILLHLASFGALPRHLPLHIYMTPGD